MSFHKSDLLTAVNEAKPHITVRDLTMAYGDFVLMRDLDFTVNHGDIFIIMGGSGCGKSTLMKIMVGLKSPAKGQVLSLNGTAS
jgi:phospholipid/cholesterol/gamma-HCH transport system ATP-binding protein